MRGMVSTSKLPPAMSRRELADRSDRPVETVVADVDAAPAAFEQGFAGDDLAGGVDEGDQDLHHARLDIGGSARPGDRSTRRTDRSKAEREIRPRRQFGGGQRTVSRYPNRIVHRCRPQSSANHRQIIGDHHPTCADQQASSRPRCPKGGQDVHCIAPVFCD